MAYKVLFLVVCAGLCFTIPCLGSVQHPTLSSCSLAQDLTVSGVSISNAKVGQTMLFNYTGDLTTLLANSPVLNLTMTAKTSGNIIPCFLNVGSCQYKLCGGTTTIEQEIGAPWDNRGPISVMTYTSSVAIAIPSEASVVIGDGKMHLKIVAMNGGSVIGCTELDFNITEN
ncbi:uncharacterized protein LOC115322576 [Ixodes scapularis]|uniref:uncharacterized protein LOC115322576 n=1 Tax=Ixodes scapularis TaxID=6945 RepID=UPI001A9E1902|nr:uncharacterized protein LOC115322576 [Ixodes scapularis]